jgi:SAM-dependent methyltransferase
MLNHNTIDRKNRDIYKKKKIIKLIYNNYYSLIKNNLLKNNNYPILEIGSGGGNIKKFIKECITSDQFKNENIDRIENIYKIKFNNNSLSNIILIDVFHHLEFPLLALNEINRVLIKHGRLIMIEPAMGLIPRIIYKIFHYEPNGFNIKINRRDKISARLKFKKYFASQSFPWRIFFLNELDLKNNFKKKKITLFSDFAFLLSGGYSYRAFYPKTFYPVIKYVDKILSVISLKIFSSRMLIVIEKI